MASEQFPTGPEISGVFAPVVTPFSGDDLDTDGLSFNLRKLNESNLSGYFVLGTNGEFRSLSSREQEVVLNICMEEAKDKVLIGGASAESTSQVITAIHRLHEIGFRFVAVQPPSYFSKAVTQETILRFFTNIADESPLKVILYNAPRFLNGVTIAPATARSIATHHNIVGIKDSGPNGPFSFVASCGDLESDFSVLAGSATFLYPGLQAGTSGGVVSLANAVPEACCALFDLFRQGEFSEAKELHNRIVKLNAAVSGTYGVAGVKSAMNLCGYRGGNPRPPLSGLTDSEIAVVEAALNEAGVR